MSRTTIIAVLAGVALLAACASETKAQKHEVGCVAGTLTGAVLGGVLGSAIGGGTGQVIATTIGTVGGGVAGHSLACG